MPTKLHPYDYITSQLARNVPVSTVMDRAVARYTAESAETLQEMLRVAIAAFAAGSAHEGQGDDFVFPDDDVPQVPGGGNEVWYHITFWHNPGEYVRIVHKTKRTVALHQLTNITKQAVEATGGFRDKDYVQIGKYLVIYQGGKIDVPVGFWLMQIQQVARR